MMELTIGKKIPAFKTINQRGEEFSSKDLLGKKTILYFYPKDDTPTCTTQACNLRDNYNRFLSEGYQIFGVSPDNAKRHQKFIEKYDLPFDLLVDDTHKICEKFGVWVQKQMYGRVYMGVLRTTFVLDDKSKIVEIINKVKSKEHSDQILGKQDVPSKP